MRKNYALLKQYVFALILLFITTIIICSCKKDTTDVANQIVDQTPSLNEAKAFFQNTILSTSPLTKAALNIKKNISASDLANNEDLNDLLYKEPIWSKAYYKSLNNSIAMVIPIHFQVKSFIRTSDVSGVNFENLNYLLITKTTDELLAYDWVTLYPTIEWIKGNRKNYLGRITVKDWDGNIKNVYTYNGTEIESYSSASPLSFESLLNQYQTGGTGRLMSGGPGIKLMDGRRYKDLNGKCWENLREVQTDNSSGPGVTLYRKEIDCALLEPNEPPKNPTKPNDPLLSGSNGTGGGGGGGGGYIPCNQNEILANIPEGMGHCSDATIVEENMTITPPSCRSFNYSKVTNNWQTAGVKNIFQTYVDLKYEVVIQIDYQPLYFQMPYTRVNGQDFTGTGVAATKSAEILQAAFQEGFYYFTVQVKNGKRGSELKSLMERKILEYADNIMNSRYGGNVTKSPPMGFHGELTNYKDWYYFQDNCLD